MIFDPEKLIVYLKSISGGLNTGTFIIPLKKINWDIEDVEPDDDEGILDLVINYEDEVILCTGKLSAVFRTPCARCLEPALFTISEDVSREYTWKPDPSDEQEKEIISRFDELNIFNALREAVLLSIPGKPLCSPDCAGISYN